MDQQPHPDLLKRWMTEYEKNICELKSVSD
jgi:hypothetical protein